MAEQESLADSRRVYAGCSGVSRVVGLIETGREGDGEPQEGGGSVYVVGLQSPLLRTVVPQAPR